MARKSRRKQPRISVEERNALVERNMRLAQKFADLYAITALERSDRVQIAAIGMLRGCEQWDEERSTLASWCSHHARTEIHRAAARAQPISVPMHVYWRYMRDARHVGMPRAIYSAYGIRSFVCLDMPYRDSGPLSDWLIAGATPDPMDVAIEAESRGRRHAMLQRLLAALPPRAASMLRFRYGLGCRPLTFREIGYLFHVSKQRCKQICDDAIVRLRELASDLAYEDIERED